MKNLSEGFNKHTEESMNLKTGNLNEKSEKERKKEYRNMKSISEIQGTPLSTTHIGVTGVLDGEEKEKGRKKIWRHSGPKFSKCDEKHERKNCQWRILYPSKISFKNGRLKTFPDRQKVRKDYFEQTCPTRNAKGSPVGRNEKALDNNLYPYKEIKSISKGNYIGKYKRQYLFGLQILSFPTYMSLKTNA